MARPAGDAKGGALLGRERGALGLPGQSRSTTSTEFKTDGGATVEAEDSDTIDDISGYALSGGANEALVHGRQTPAR